MTFRIDIGIGQLLATEGTVQFKFLKFNFKFINELGPLVHLQLRRLIELSLLRIVLLLELNGHLIDEIIFKLQNFGLFFEMFHENLSFFQFFRQIVRCNIDGILELFRRGEVYVFAYLPILI